MKVVLLHQAETEFWESVDYYEQQSPGLGIRFKEEVDRFLQKIKASLISHGYGKESTDELTFRSLSTILLTLFERILSGVVAICHAYKEPEFFLSRLREHH